MRNAFLAAAGAALLALAGVAVAASNCKMVRLAEWKLQPVRDALVVDGSVNGQKLGVMIDTGAGSTIVLRSAAKQLGLRGSILQGFKAFGLGAEGEVEVAYIDEFRIGPSVRNNLQMFIAGQNDLAGTVGVILGEDFFQKGDIEFDLAHNAIRLYQPQGCEGASLAYWVKEGASEVALEPIDPARPQIVFMVQVNGRMVKALLDSGSATSMVDKFEAGKAGVTPETPGVTPVNASPGKKADLWIGPFQSFTIGDEMIRNTQLQFTDFYADATFNPTGTRIARKVEELQPFLLGADFLRSHRVLVSHSQKKLYFTYAGGPVFQTAKAAEPKPSSQ
jgi:predicted aspartyl protease